MIKTEFRDFISLYTKKNGHIWASGQVKHIVDTHSTQYC